MRNDTRRKDHGECRYYVHPAKREHSHERNVSPVNCYCLSRFFSISSCVIRGTAVKKSYPVRFSTASTVTRKFLHGVSMLSGGWFGTIMPKVRVARLNRETSFEPF